MNKRGVVRVAVGEYVSEAVYQAVAKVAQHVVDKSIHGTVYDVVYTRVGATLEDALYKTTVFDLTNIDKVRELI